MKRTLLVSCGIAALFLTGPAFAETDEAFLDQAMQINLSEISMGQLAQHRGSSNAIKQYGQRLVIDHIINAGQVMALVRDMGAAPATQVPASNAAIHEQLMGINEANFDRAFALRMVEGHQLAIKLFEEKAGESGQAAEYAEATLPILQEHLQLAEELTTGEQQAANPDAVSNTVVAPASGEGLTTETASSESTTGDEQTATAGNEVVAEQQRPMATMSPDVSAAASPQTNAPSISAEALIGMTVYGTDNSNIGEISDVILSQDGAEGGIDAVIIDVGGFLGIGAKPVAVGFDSLEIRPDEAGNLYAYSRYAQEQLESAAEYDPESYGTNRETMRLAPRQ